MSLRSRRVGHNRRVARDDTVTPDVTVAPDPADDDWKWRQRLRSNPQSHLILRIVVAIVGLVIVIVGLIMVPLPGPGWLVVFLGLAVWATEFVWAQRLLQRARRTLEAWNDWIMQQAWWVRGLVLLLTIAAVALFFWALFLISGVPSYLPDVVEVWLKKVPGLR
jgi:uncharacterized protein (TIGR02611 family)